MANNTITPDILNKITGMLLTEVHGRAGWGVTYTLFMKDSKTDMETFQTYKTLPDEITKAGLDANRIFRIFEVPNGYICDIDVEVVREITIKLGEKLAKSTNGQTPQGDLIGIGPEKRRREDIRKLAEFLEKEFKEGRKKVEVALFSKNNVPRIIISGTDKNGNPASLRYNAYVIRHWDIEVMNRELLAAKGIRVSAIDSAEIIPSKTGVRFVLTLSKV